MRGEIRSHHVTPFLKSTTRPSIWTTRWPEIIPWGLYISRASMWPKQATGRLKTTDTQVNTLHIPPWARLSFVSFFCRWSDASVCFQWCWSSAVACQWAEEVFRTCTTPSSCTSIGEARPVTALSTQCAHADTQWRYSMVSRQLYTVQINRCSEQVPCRFPLMSLCFLCPDAHCKHEVHPPKRDSSHGWSNRTCRSWILHWC